MISPVLSADFLLRESAVLEPVIGLDTGGSEASLGIVAHGQIKSAVSLLLRSHCAGLPGAVDEVLRGAGLQLGDLAGIAVGIGPGSFTGLRIGLSYAKGLASARRFPITGVSSLDSMALCGTAQLSLGTLVCPLIDARRGEVYAALYRFSGNALERITGDMVVPLTRLISQIGGEVRFIGGAKAAEARTTAEAHGLIASHWAEIEQRGSWIAALGAARIAQTGSDRLEALEPLYVRAADAVLKPGGPP